MDEQTFEEWALEALEKEFGPAASTVFKLTKPDIEKADASWTTRWKEPIDHERHAALKRVLMMQFRGKVR